MGRFGMVAGRVLIREAAWMANWTREQTLLLFRLYCQIPYGRMSAGTPEVVALATLIGRSNNAIPLKASNFARLDPLHRARGVKGMSHGAKLEEVIWAEFETASAAVADEAEAIYEWAVAHKGLPKELSEHKDIDRGRAAETSPIPSGETESRREVKTRRVQSFFRAAVLSSYGGRCGLTGLSVPGLLNASHIVPWAERESSRADP